MDFNRYADEQEFLGLKSLVLDNLYQDISLIRERLAMKLFNRMKVPAPRESFARLYVNEQFVGVYAIVESIDKRFMKRVEGIDADSYLYEYKWQDVWWFGYLGPELEPYEVRFSPRTHENESSSQLFGPIEAFLNTVNEPHDVARDVGEFLRVRLFLRQLAVEAFLAEWDGLVGDFGVNNFYLCREPHGKEFAFFPWDKDNTFRSPTYFIRAGIAGNVLARRLHQHPVVHRPLLQRPEDRRGRGLTSRRRACPKVGPAKLAAYQIDRIHLADPGCDARGHSQAEHERRVRGVGRGIAGVRCRCPVVPAV